MQTANDEETAAIVLILRPDGSVGGTGFLASDSGLIATCSHVVQEVRLQELGEPPPSTCTIVFHATGNDRVARVTIAADVVADWWRPISGADVAILRVPRIPDGVRSARLGASGGTQDHVVRSFGYPDTAAIEGIPGKGELIGDTYQDGRRILVGRSPEITAGFSGGPVWDDARRRVVGMVTLITQPDDAGRLEETFFATTTETLLEICPDLEIADVAPYRDLEAFDEPDREFLFGRRALIDQLVARLDANPRFLALLGPTGSGKSSVVRAGLVPELRDGAVTGSDRWAIAVFRPLQDPLGQLGATAIGPVDDLPAAVARARDRGASRLVLVIDQAEELFTQTPEAIAHDFLAGLASLLGEEPVTVILTLRSDFYGRLGDVAPSMLRWLETGLLNTDPTIDEDDLTAIVEAPAGLVGLSFAPGLVRLIVDDALDAAIDIDGRRVAGSTVLPLLEFGLTRLWEQRRDGELTHEAYRALGGITGALTQWADDTYAGFTDEEAAVAERVFVDLVHFGDPRAGNPDTRRRRELAGLASAVTDRTMVGSVVDRLVARRLLVMSGGVEADPLTVEIVHDALLRRWGRLSGWIATERLYRTWLQAIQDQVDEWTATSEAGRSDLAETVVLRGPQLDDAERWFAEHKSDMGPELLAFIDASRAVHRKEVRRTRERTVAVVGLAVVALGLLGWTGVRAAQEWAARAEATAAVTGFERGPATLGPTDARVTLDVPAFSIDQTEVSARQYRLCVQVGRCTALNVPPGTPDDAAALQLPAVWVTAAQAAEFCRWLGRRLPTFVEWERAVRGPTYRAWPWADGAPASGDRVNALFEAVGETEPGLVAVDHPAFDDGATPEGIRHLLGNAREWTSTPTTCDPYACAREWTTQTQESVALWVVGFSATDQFRPGTGTPPFAPIEVQPNFADDITGFRCASS